MTDDISDNNEESFESLLNSYSTKISADIATGEKISGEIIHVGHDTVYVSTGTKTDGVIDKTELLNEEGDLPFQTGDMVDLYVVKVTESEIILSKALSGKADSGIIMDAYNSETPVEGKVTEVCKGGLNVQVLGKRSFCPISQIDTKYVEDAETYVGNTFHFLITRVEDGGKNIVVSRREYLNIDIEQNINEFFKNSVVGDIVPGVVTKLMPYGAFIELVPGLEGMAHISELSWSRIEKPEDAVREGDKVNVKILSIEEGKKENTYKISLSVNKASQDPWDLIDSNFHVGDTIKGKVTRILKFGAFVEIAPGIEGLVHISEMSYIKRILKPDDVVSPGDIVDIQIKSIDALGRKLSLSIRDAAGDPWMNADEKYKPGQEIEGTLSKKESFGYFINLEPGITALLPKSKINEAENSKSLETSKVGAVLKLVVESINLDERKLSLTTKTAGDDSTWKPFSGNTSSIGSLGDLLKSAMDKKK